MPSLKAQQTHLNIANAIFNYNGATGDMDAITGSIVSAVGNGLSVCIEVIEAAHSNGLKLKDLRPASLKLSKFQIASMVFRPTGPLLGLTQDEYVTLAVACALAGISTAGLAAALLPLLTAGAVASPAIITLAALGLFGDCIGVGAAQAGLEARIRKQLANRGKRLSARQIEMVINQYYRSRPASCRYI